MITIKLPITLNEEDITLIKEMQRLQSSMIRSAYVRAKQGNVEIDIRSYIRTTFKGKLDSWFHQSAVKSGIAMAKADEELSTDKRIFGSKQMMSRRTKGLITNNQWKESRLMPVYLIGESNYKGNRKFNFSVDSILFKPVRGTTIHIDLPALKKKWARLWEQACLLASENKIPITVTLCSKFIRLTFDDSLIVDRTTPFKLPIKDRYAGIDMNPNYIGVSIFDKQTLIETKMFSLKELTGKHASNAKLNHETIEIGHSSRRWLKHHRVDTLFVEQLNFKQGDSKKGKSFNRLTQNQWKRSVLENTLSKYFKLYNINAAYTSTIGNVLHPELPDPIAASTAVAQRGYELCIIKSKKFYPELPEKKVIEDRWKKPDVPDFQDWKELHSWLKKTGLKYRVDVPEASMFRIFQSHRSGVGII